MKTRKHVDLEHPLDDTMLEFVPPSQAPEPHDWSETAAFMSDEPAGSDEYDNYP